MTLFITLTLKQCDCHAGKVGCNVIYYAHVLLELLVLNLIADILIRQVQAQSFMLEKLHFQLFPVFRIRTEAKTMRHLQFSLYLTKLIV